MNVSLHCPHCDSENITRDGLLRWCKIRQAWEASSELDMMTCDDCGEDFHQADEKQCAPGVEIADISRAALQTVEHVLSEILDNRAHLDLHAEDRAMLENAHADVQGALARMAANA